LADGELFQSKLMLTWSESRMYCEEIGKDNNQAWVYAREEFSDYVKVPDCIATLEHFVPHKSFDTDLISNCLKFCSGTIYVGVKQIRSMNCNYTCNNNPLHECGGNKSISLYEKGNSMSALGDVKLYTGSCVGHTADGVICEAGERLCRMERVNYVRWKEANTYCADIGGHLAVSSRVQSSNMQEKSTYWLGYYHIPMINNVSVGYLVLIEGDNCQAKHAIIYQENVFKRTPVTRRSQMQQYSKKSI
ncbi:hypothetical protein ACJMK2_022709, partial [Sinanodonta woodiana]